MKSKLLLSLIVILMLSPRLKAQGIQPPAEGKSVIYIVNLMFGFGETRIYDGSTLIEILKDKDYIRYECEPGEHLFLGLDGSGNDFFTTDFEANNIYLLSMRSVETSSFQSSDFNLFDKTSVNEAAKILAIINENAPNESGDDLLEETAIKLEKRARKALLRYETKLKKKRKYIHLSKEMFYQE